jgi:hypothetical protein
VLHSYRKGAVTTSGVNWTYIRGASKGPIINNSHCIHTSPAGCACTALATAATTLEQ